MSIQEISPSQVPAWSERVADHMVSARLASGQISSSGGQALREQVRLRLRVGVPRGSYVFVNDDCSQWVWVSKADVLHVVDSYFTSDLDQWAAAVESIAQGRLVLDSIFAEDLPDDLRPLVAREQEVCMRIKLDAQCSRVSVNGSVSLRPMTMVELREFITRIRGAEDALCGDGFVDDIAEHDRLVGNDPHSAFEYAASSMMPPSLRHAPLEAMQDDGVASPGHQVLAICVDSTVIGGMWWEADGQKATLWRICIYHGWRGKNFFAAAMRAFLARCALEGITSVRLSLDARGTSAIATLRNLGFRVTARSVLLDPQAFAYASQELRSA